MVSGQFVSGMQSTSHCILGPGLISQPPDSGNGPLEDAWYERAVAAGATSMSEPANQPYGDRVAEVTDPFGNTWYIATDLQQIGS